MVIKIPYDGLYREAIARVKRPRRLILSAGRGFDIDAKATEAFNNPKRSREQLPTDSQASEVVANGNPIEIVACFRAGDSSEAGVSDGLAIVFRKQELVATLQTL